MRIGRLYIGLRHCTTQKFRWFYHPLLPAHERRLFKFFVWIGWHFYAFMDLKKEERKP